MLIRMSDYELLAHTHALAGFDPASVAERLP